VTKRSIVIEDLLRIRFPQQAAVSPDGRRVAFALTHLDSVSNEILGALWVVPIDGRSTSPLTADDARDTTPKWSPDGRSIAFLSNRSGKRRGWKRSPMQLWLMPADGGEGRQLTAFKTGVSEFAWSPDGRTIAFITRGELEEVEREPDEDEVIVREIRRPKYKFDRLGFLEGYAQLWTVPAAGGTPVQLTIGDFDHEGVAWLPSGREIVVVANRSPQADFSFARDLWLVDATTGALRQLTHKTGPCASPKVSPDGNWISFVGHDYPESSARNAAIWVVPSAGGTPTNLTAHFDHSVGNSVGTDVRLVPLLPSTAWTVDSSAIIFFATVSGRTHLHSVGVQDKTVRQLTDGDEVIADLTAGGGMVVYQRISPTSLDELWVLDPNGRARRLVGVNDDLLGELELGKTKRFSYEGADGWPMEGWMLTPPGFDPAKKYPAILRIHGGPHGAFGEAFGHYPQVLAARGYVLVYVNPRGSQGYGEAFARSVVSDWGRRTARTSSGV
jgi:dipeptidyl aminopeptidase/acylaminoacyl peptidase